MKSVNFLLSTLVLALTIGDVTVKASPQFDLMGGFDFMAACINNCAQCKKMYGTFFDGALCADACLKFHGKIIPDCEDIGSIAPFLTKIDVH